LKPLSPRPAAALNDSIATTAFARTLPEFFGGSAGLTGSNLTDWKGCITVDRGNQGNYVHYDVRVRHDRDAERHRPLPRLHPVRGTFVVFEKVCPQRHPPGANEAALDPDADP
jgi:transketolase